MHGREGVARRRSGASRERKQAESTDRQQRPDPGDDERRPPAERGIDETGDQE
jgi:hypothetical protein